MPASLEFPMKGTVPIKKGGCESILFFFCFFRFFQLILQTSSSPTRRSRRHGSSIHLKPLNEQAFNSGISNNRASFILREKEFKLEFELPAKTHSNYQAVYYASDQRGGVTVETVAVVSGGKGN